MQIDEWEKFALKLGYFYQIQTLLTNIKPLSKSTKMFLIKIVHKKCFSKKDVIAGKFLKILWNFSKELFS